MRKTHSMGGEVIKTRVILDSSREPFSSWLELKGTLYMGPERGAFSRKMNKNSTNHEKFCGKITKKQLKLQEKKEGNPEFREVVKMKQI